MRRTKIVVTIGPSTQDVETIEALINKGVNVFRLNFSHGTHAEHEENIKKIRQASKNTGRVVAILQDISGPKVRIGKIDGILKLKKGDLLKLCKKAQEKNELEISYPAIVDMVALGDEVFFSDGTIKSLVIDKDKNCLTLKLLNSGELTSFKGVNFPKTKLNISAITKKDEADLAFGAKHDIDFVALSFVQCKADILKAKKILKKLNFNPFIIAKIETATAMQNLDEILQVSDGVMVARGDLGAEFGVTKLPRIQKHIIKKANELNKPSITATQMLSSMKENPFPTRAEVSDIANAVYDGTDAVMLSDETAVGKYPLEAVQVLHDTIKDVEKEYPYFKDFQVQNSSDVVAKAAVQMSENLKDPIVTFTTSGYSAKAISRFRPGVNVYAVSHSLKTHRQLSLIWGVRPLFVMEKSDNPSKLLYLFVKKLLDENRISKDKQFIVTMGSVSGKAGSTNLIRLLDKEGMEAVFKYKF